MTFIWINHFFPCFLFPVSRRFSQILKRQTSLNHLCQVTIMIWMLFFNKVHMNKQLIRGYEYACVEYCRIICVQASRTVINSADITFQMLEDWRNVDLNSITKQTLYTMEDSQEEHRQLIIHCKYMQLNSVYLNAPRQTENNTSTQTKHGETIIPTTSRAIAL